MTTTPESIMERVRKLEEQNMEDYTFLLNLAHDFGAKDGEDMRKVIYKGIADLRAQAAYWKNEWEVESHNHASANRAAVKPSESQ